MKNKNLFFQIGKFINNKISLYINMLPKDLKVGFLDEFYTFLKNFINCFNFKFYYE